MKRFFVPILMCAATSVVAAPDYLPLPIEQREATPSNVNYPQAVQYAPLGDQSVAGQQLNPLQGASAPATPSRPSQPPIPSNVQWELYTQLQEMQQEVSRLRGMLEEQAHEISQLKEQQRQRYLDLDHRLTQMKSGQNAVNAATGSAPIAAEVPEAAAFDDKGTYDQAIALMRQRKFDQAIGLLEELLLKAPASSYVPNSQYWLGELYMAITPPDYETAKKHLITLLKDNQDHQKVPDALYKLGMLYKQQGELGKARVTLEKVIADYPTRQAAKLAKRLLTEL